MDSQIKAQELASLILSSSSPSQISSCCTAIEAFLKKHSTDHSRSFFSLVFPALIFKFFGFEGPALKSSSSTGWIDKIQSSSDSDLAAVVFKLFSPSGIIFSLIHAVDRHFLVKYVFPIERLPEWTRFMLQSDRDCHILSDLCPLFKDRVKEDSMKGSFQFQLNVFEYYMFWFAYYPVCKGRGDDTDSKQVIKNRRFGLEKWTSSLPVLQSSNRGPVMKTECNFYNRLLYAYLRAFMPNPGLNKPQPYRSSLLHYSPNEDGSITRQDEFLAHALINFWLVGNDISPLPVNVCRSFGVSFPFRAISDPCPPIEGLGEVVKIFVMYLNSNLISQDGSFRSVSSQVVAVQSRTTVPSFSYGNSVGSWNSLVQRPLYRFILRSFLFCPIGTSMKNAGQVFRVWMTYLEPWKITSEDFAEFNLIGDLKVSEVERNFPKGVGNEKCLLNCSYTASWQGYVLSNYLFYSSLLMHFVGFAHKFLHVNAGMIIQMTLKVLNILTSSKELVDLLKKVDAAYHSKSAGSSSPIFDSSYKFIPSVHEQLLDWEDGLSRFESDANGLYSCESTSDLKLFSANEDGGHQLLQLLILRAEPEIQACSGDKLAENLHTLDSLKAQLKFLFGPAGLPGLATPNSGQIQPGRDEVFTPKHPSAGIEYRGDWMTRPITDSEVAWLVRLLVSLSEWLNESLSHAGTAWSYVDVTGDEAVLPVRFGRWVVQGVVKFMREHELRINVRFLASKVVVVIFLACVFFSFLKMACASIFCSPAN